MLTRGTHHGMLEDAPVLPDHFSGHSIGRVVQEELDRQEAKDDLQEALLPSKLHTDLCAKEGKNNKSELT